ncbi:MAG: glutathione synthase [Gammaproteobacteria bacterium]|nr:glutathione synthase [Gammaproteobacteria bacterium]
MLNFGIIMDSIENINPKTDTTFSIVKELQKKAKIKYIHPNTLCLSKNIITARTSELNVYKKNKNFYKLNKSRKTNLNKLDCILFRTDPPVDENYIHTTFLLDIVEKKGTLVINSPQSLRDFNEKIIGLKFNKGNLPTIISRNINEILKFIKQFKKVVVKPLNMMAGKNIELLQYNDSELKKKINKLTNNEIKFVVVQKFLNVSKKGDKRIIIYNGNVCKKVITRFPPKNDFRANLRFGGKYKISNLAKEYLDHLDKVAIYLKAHRIFLAGVDMIGDCITEINITSPTGVQEIDRNTKINLSNKICRELLKLTKSYHDNKK